MLRSAVRLSGKSLFGSILLFACFTLPASGQIQTTLRDVHHDVSRPWREMAATVTAEAPEEREAEPARFIPLPAGLKPAGDADSVLQRATLEAPTLLAPTPGLNFEGMGTGLTNFIIAGAPPDTNGAVGLTQYVQSVNLSLAVFDKTTGALTFGPVPGKSLWQGFGGNCEVNNDGDPIILYDKLADRWVFSQFSVRTPGVPGSLGPFLQCVAVSTTPDATGTYNRYSFQYSAFDDYPKMGVWPDAYYVTFNMFGGPSLTFSGADACAYDRTAMLAGQAATQVCFQQGASVGGLLPSDLDGHIPPPAGSPNFMVFFGANVLNLFKFHVDFATPANSTFTGPTVIPVAPFTALCNGGRGCVPQPPPPVGTAASLDSLGDRLMYRLAYRNFGDHESLVVNHSVAVGATASSGGGVRWYEIQNPNGTPTVAQQSTFAPDANFRWMGSIAMDQVGDIALGYSVSSSTTFPSVAFTARSAGDPAGTMQPETTIISGTGSQTTDSFGNQLTRWGDYSAMQVDPSDDCTFWYTTEYMKNSGIFNWNTRIATFKFPGCDKPDLTISSTHTGNFTQGQTGAVYTLTATNAGGIDTTGTVTVTDTLPSGLTASAISGTGWSCDLPTLTCTRSDVLASKASYPVITATLNVANNAAGILTNNASVSGGGEVDTANDNATDTTTIIQLGPDPTVAIAHSGTFIQGQPGTYNISVSNVGLSALNGTQVTVTDTLPAGLTANAASGTGWACLLGPPVTCTRTDALASNASYPPITLTVNIASNALGSVINTVSVSGGGETNTLNDTSSDTVTVIPPPADLTITKTHVGNFQQGQTFASYTITVTNSGSGSTAGSVSVTDTLPTGLTFTNMFGGGWNCNLQTCTRSDTLVAGASYPVITVNVNVASNAPASVTNTAVVSGGGEVNTANDTANDVTTITPTPDLAITKTHVGDFTVGQSGTYTITVSNVGSGPTTAPVTMNDFLPFGMTATAVTATGWTCPNILPTTFVSCNRSDALAAANSYPQIVVTVRVDGAQSPVVINSAGVSGGGELNFANDNASDPTNVNAPTLAIAKTHSPATFIVGQTGTYTITVSNTGTVATSGSTSNPVTVTDFLPFGMTATDLSASTGWSCSAVPTTFVNCSRTDALAAAGSYPAIVMAVRIDGSSAATVTNQASVSGGGDLSTHFASDPTPVTAPILAITKTHTGTFTVGQTGDYTLTVSNSGTIATLGTVTVTDFLPFGMTATALNASGWNCQPLPTTFVTCTRSDALAAGGSYPSIVLTVSLDGNVSSSVSNNASVTGGGDLNSHSASDLTAVNVPDLAVTMSHTGDFIPGQHHAYIINITNVGTVSTAGGTVNVNDFLPFGLTPTAASGAGWINCSIFFSSVTCSRPAGNVAPGTGYPPLQIDVNVAPDAPATVTNSVTVSGIGDANFSNNTAADPTNIVRVGITSNNSSNLTVTAGSGATFVFTANLATNSPIGVVTFGAIGLPPHSTASFSPASVTQSGPAAVTINTSGNGHVVASLPANFNPSTPAYVALFFPCAGLIGMVMLRRRGRKSWLARTVYVSCLGLLLGFAGCGGGSSTPPPPPPPAVTPAGTYVITMTATSSNPSIAPATFKVTLNVQ
jgi:uncharacterized repeat protein (TIGR01451 family)